jgi:hypothetical protein
MQIKLEIYKNMTDEELLEVYKNQYNYTDEVIDFIRNELLTRGVDLSGAEEFHRQQAIQREEEDAKRQKREEFMAEEMKSYEGIRGWLILPLIGLFIAPIRISLTIFKDLVPVFTEGYWNVITTPGSNTYHPLWAPLIIFECVGNIVFIIFSIVLLIFFFRKSRLLPKLMISYLILSLLFVVSDFFLADLIPAVADQRNYQDTKEIARAVIGTIVWVPYFLVSKRVKQTFVR